MVLSKGLIISLGFSALSCTLLFLYFRNKITTVERKVNVMFDLVQNYQPTQEYSSQSNQSYEPVNEDTEHHQDNQNNENTGAWNLNAEDDRIVISDDSDDDDDDDSDEVSDSDSDDESEEIPKLSLAKTDNISLTENDIKKISVKETPLIDDTIELEEVDSLDEIDDDDDDDDNDNNNSEIEISNKDIKKISVTKNDTEENIDNNYDDNNENDNEDDNEESEDNDEVSEDNDEVDYTQLKVSELKSIAEAKGLTNYKSLKKTPLIDLIKSAE